VRTQLAREFFVAEHGREPVNARELVGQIAKDSRPRTQTAAGYDLTFSPVKSVSTLWAVADPAVAAAIERAHVPMMFATTHPWQVRRRNVKVIRVKELAPHLDWITSAEHCWLIAASTLNLLDLVTAGLASQAAAHRGPITVGGSEISRPRHRSRAPQ
jgi:hypothetical protein